MFERWRTHRALRRIPELTPEAIEGQLARVTGIVQILDEALRAPRSELLCVAYRIQMMVGGRDTVRGQFETTELRPFVVVRGAASPIVIDATEARFDLPSTPAHEARVDGEQWREFLEAHGLNPSSHNGDEITVAPGLVITVAGTVVVDPDVQPPDRELGFRDESPRRIKLTGDFDHPLLIGRPVDRPEPS